MFSLRFASLFRNSISQNPSRRRSYTKRSMPSQSILRLENRLMLAGVLGTAANVGQVVMGLLGLWIDVTPEAWRWTFLAGAAPAVIGIWCLVGVPESVR